MKTEVEGMAEALRAFVRAIENAGTWYGNPELELAEKSAIEALAQYDAAAPAAPGAAVGVDEAMVERALSAMDGGMLDSRPFWTDEDRRLMRAALVAAPVVVTVDVEPLFNQLSPDDCPRLTRRRLRAALTAALAGKAGAE